MGIELDQYRDYDKPNDVRPYETYWNLYEGSGVTPVWQDTATGSNNGHNRFTILTTFTHGTPNNFKLKPSTRYRLTVQFVGTSGISSDTNEVYFTTASSFTYPFIEIKVKDTINLSKCMLSSDGWTKNNIEVYINNSLNLDILDKFEEDFTLSSSGDILKIVKKTDPETYPPFNFGALKDTLLEVISPLPYMPKAEFASNGYYGSASTWRGHGFGNCTSLEKVTPDLFKFNTLLRYLGGCHSQEKPWSRTKSKVWFGDIYGCFSNCTSLKEIPEKLFKPLCELEFLGGIGEFAYYSNTSETKINSHGCFTNCTSLITLPKDLLYYSSRLSVLNGYGGSISPNDNISDCYCGDGYGAFQGCSGLVTLPSHFIIGSSNSYGSISSLGGLGGSVSAPYGENSSITATRCYGGDGYGAFYGCTGLQEIPSEFFINGYHALSLGGNGGNAGSADYINGASNSRGGIGFGAFENCTGLLKLNPKIYSKSLKNSSILSRWGGFGGYAGNGGSVYGSNGKVGGNGGDNCTGGDGHGAFQGCTKLAELSPELFCEFDDTQNIQGSMVALSGVGGSCGNGGSTYKETSHGGNGGNYCRGGDGFNAFYGCNSLTTLPVDLFKNITPTSYEVTFTGDISKSNPGSSRGTGKGGTVGIGGKCGKSYGAFSHCASLIDVPLDLFQPFVKKSCTLKFGHGYDSLDASAGEIGGVFEGCTKLTVRLNFKGLSRLYNNRINNFARGTATRGTVYVTRGSVYATAFKNDPSSNVNVIEEDMA